MAPPAFIVVFYEPGTGVSEEEFNDWYDNEHIPLRLELPNSLFASVTRWVAADGKTPYHLALYDLSLPDATSHPTYAALGGSRSPREVDILGSFRYANTYPEALALLSSGKLASIDKLITHRFSLEDSVDAFELLAKGKDAEGRMALKVFIKT